KITTLFIDKGGVLIDNTTLSPQYRRLLGEFLPTELGGDPDAWANANAGAASRAFARYRRAPLTAPPTSIRDWYADDGPPWVYGSDLLNVWKSSPAYYQAILADTATDPGAAVVVDDSERAIAWAAECGLRGVQVRRQAGEPFEDSVLRAFDEVSALL